MADAEKREKVIRGLECCKWSRQNVKPEKNKCDECPYKDQNIMSAFAVWRSCTNVLAGDALALLKEQEPVKPFGGYGFYFCGGCKNPFNSVSQKFCSECGQAVKWDD